MAGLFLFLRAMESGDGGGGFTGNILYGVLILTFIAGLFYTISMAIGLIAMFLTTLGHKRLMLKFLYAVVGLTVLFVVATAGTGLIARTVGTVRSENGEMNPSPVNQTIIPPRSIDKTIQPVPVRIQRPKSLSS